MTASLPAPLRAPVFPDWWPDRPSALPPNGPPPRITVVTPSFNQAAYLESTIRSVLSQEYPNLDYIVVDGGSRDGSVDIIRHYAAHLSSWVAEPDRGQTDAILKGLERATGEWFNWINSDDLLAPGALWRIARAAKDADVVAGAVRNFSRRGVRAPSRNKRLDVSAAIFHHLGGGMRYHQPGVWLRRDALRAGAINRDRHYKFDYEMMLRYLNRHPRVRYLSDVLAFFRLHEDSKTVSKHVGAESPFHREHMEILEQLAAAPEFADRHDDLHLAARQYRWWTELHRYDDAAERRSAVLRRLFREVREDPAARCIRPSRQTALRLLRAGFWPQAWTRAARKKL